MPDWKQHVLDRKCEVHMKNHSKLKPGKDAKKRGSATTGAVPKYTPRGTSGDNINTGKCPPRKAPGVKR